MKISERTILVLVEIQIFWNWRAGVTTKSVAEKYLSVHIIKFILLLQVLIDPRLLKPHSGECVCNGLWNEFQNEEILVESDDDAISNKISNTQPRDIGSDEIMETDSSGPSNYEHYYGQAKRKSNIGAVRGRPKGRGGPISPITTAPKRGRGRPPKNPQKIVPFEEQH